jgi:hypothetical protein
MFRALFKFFLTLLASCLVVVFLIPVIISTKPGQKQLLKFISVATRTSIEAERITIDWFGPQFIQQLHIKSHFIDIYFEEIKAKDSLIEAIFHGGKFSTIELKEPDGLIRLNTKKKSFGFVPFKELTIDNGNIQIQTVDRIYRFNPLNIHLKTGKVHELIAKGLLSQGLDKGNFALVLKADPNSINLLAFETEFFPLELLQESVHSPLFSSLIEQIGSNLKGKILFNRQARQFTLDLKTNKAFLQYPYGKSNDLYGEIKRESSQTILSGKNILINFEDLRKSSFAFDLVLPEFSIDTFQIKNAKAHLVFQQGDQITIQTTFSSLSNFLKGPFSIQGTINKNFKDSNFEITSKEVSFYEPITKKWNNLSLDQAAILYKNGVWQSKSIFSTSEKEKIETIFETSLTQTLFELPKNLSFKIDSKILQSTGAISLSSPLMTTSSTYFSAEIPLPIAKKIAPSFGLKKPLRLNGMLEKNSSIYDIKGVFNVPLIEATIKDKMIPISFNKGEFSFNLAKYTGDLYLNGEAEKGAFTIDFSKESSDILKSRFRLDQIPTELLYLLNDFDPTALNFIGKKISGNFYYSQSGQNHELDCSATTSNGIIKFSADLDNQRFMINKPSKIALNFKADDQNNWFKQSDLFIVSEPKITIDFSELSVPLDLDFNEISLAGKFQIDDLKFYSNHEVATLQKLQGEWKKRKNNQLQAFITSAASIGTIDCSIEVDKLRLSPPQSLIPSFVGEIDIDLKQIPPIFFKAFLAPFIDDKLTLLINDYANVYFRLDAKEYPKKVRLSVDSSDFKTEIEGRLEGNDLLLIKPLQASILPTDNFKELFYSISAIHLIDTKGPITIDASSRGFIAPLHPPSLKTAQIPYFAVNLGQMVVQDDGTMDLVKLFLKQKIQSKTLLWFAPIEGQLKNGVIQLNRFDVLISPNIQVAFWGKIDLKSEYIDCVLGLTASSLKSSLGITNLPSNFVLTIPVRGKFGQVKIDKGQALTKIATLVASSQRFTGQLGGILDLMNQMMNDQGKIPKPKRPFPWEKSVSIDLEAKKDFLMRLKNQQSEEELVSYSLSIDPIIQFIQQEIATRFKANEEPVENEMNPSIDQ